MHNYWKHSQLHVQERTQGQTVAQLDWMQLGWMGFWIHNWDSVREKGHLRIPHNESHLESAARTRLSERSDEWECLLRIACSRVRFYQTQGVSCWCIVYQCTTIQSYLNNNCNWMLFLFSFPVKYIVQTALGTPWQNNYALQYIISNVYSNNILVAIFVS